MDRSTVPRSSAKIIAFNQLVVNLKTLRYGYAGRASRQRLSEAKHDYESIVKMGLNWVDDFLPASRKEYEALIGQEIDDDYVPAQKTRTLAYNATIIRIIAACHYQWTQQYSSRSLDDLATFIKGMDLRPSMQRGPLVESGVMTPGLATPNSRRQLVQRAIQSVVDGAAKFNPSK